MWAISMATIGLLILEICMWLFAIGFQYFKKVAHIIDTIVVLFSFGVMVYFANKNPDGAHELAGILSILRLFRALQTIYKQTHDFEEQQKHSIDHLRAQVKDLEKSLRVYKLNALKTKQR